ncbi:MAG: M28 family peptidase [Gemmatimonas sp.]
MARTTITSGVNTVVVDHDSVRAYNTVVRRQGSNDPVCTPTAEQQRKIDSLIKVARAVRAPRRDSIMNGADDDGSGTVVMLEIAEKFAKEKAGSLDRVHLAPGRRRRPAGLTLVHRQPHHSAHADRRGAQHGHGGQGTRLAGEVRRPQLGADARRAPAVAGIWRHHRLGERQHRRAHGDRQELGRAGQPAQSLLPQRPGELRPQGYSGGVYVAWVCHRLPPADRRTAVHRLRSFGAPGTVRASGDDGRRQPAQEARNCRPGPHHADLRPVIRPALVAFPPPVSGWSPERGGRSLTLCDDASPPAASAVAARYRHQTSPYGGVRYARIPRGRLRGQPVGGAGEQLAVLQSLFAKTPHGTFANLYVVDTLGRNIGTGVVTVGERKTINVWKSSTSTRRPVWSWRVC